MGTDYIPVMTKARSNVAGVGVVFCVVRHFISTGDCLLGMEHTRDICRSLQGI